jgi:uncharacterized membrane protein (UPF0127 family)
MDANPKLIVNLTRGNVLCERATVVDRALPRMRGLVGRPALREGDGLLLQPAPSIHTAFVRFEFDAVFLDHNLRIVRTAERIRPWRVVAAQNAFSVLQLAAGEVARRRAGVGDQIVLSEPVRDIVRVTASSDAGPQGPATRVLLVGTDRRFRSVTAALLQRRGYEVSVTDQADLAGAAAHVVVVDAAGLPAVAALEIARLQTLDPAIGLVVVGDAPGAVAKWGSIEGLSEAIDAARAA